MLHLKELTLETYVVEGNLPVISLNQLKLLDSSNLVTLISKNVSLRAREDNFLDLFESGQWMNLGYLCLPFIDIDNTDLPCSPSIEILAMVPEALEASDLRGPSPER